MKKVIIVRLGEITVKGRKTRDRFERILINNIRDALREKGISGEVRREWGRIYVYANKEAIDALRRVFGIKSLSLAYEAEFKTFEELIDLGENFFREKIRGKIFAVDARRVGQHDFTSMDIERELGARLKIYSTGVNLESPEVTAFVEVRFNRAYFFTEMIPAYGGLPIGCEGRVICLFSGGFDSAVAAWYMLKRGTKVHYLLCNLGGEAYKLATLAVARVLATKWSYGYRPKMYIVDFSKILREIREKTKSSLLNVILKRFMYRAAEKIAGRINAEAIVTGESLGQVASQTLRNLYVSSKATKIQVFRPLIGFDKDEIIELSREIGTYSLSSLVKEYCGSFAEHPETHADLHEVEEEESKIDMGILDDTIEKAEVIDLKSLKEIETTSDLEIDFIPDNSVIVDLRSPTKYASWHVPGAINIDFIKLPEQLSKLDKEKMYILLCDEGALSKEAAYMLRKLGYKAYSFKGGIRKLKRKVRIS